MRYLWIITVFFGFTACLKNNRKKTDARHNFSVFWQEVDKKYSLFKRKNIDWNEVRARYEPLLTEKTNSAVLFEILKKSLSEFRDGHVYLSTPTNVFRYKDFFLDYYPNFNPVVIRRNYLGRDERVFGGVLPTRILRGKNSSENLIGPAILYLRYSSFTTPIYNSILKILANYIKSLKVCGLIIDIRNNTGGNLDNAQTLAGFLSKENFTAGYIKFKTGPGHEDFSDFAEIKSNAETHLDNLPVIVLTDRLVYSAANFFAGAVRGLPNVTLLGDTTGGGGGMPYSNQLPNNWEFSISVNELFDPDKKPLEYGVTPHISARLRFDQEKDNLIDTSYVILSRQLK